MRLINANTLQLREFHGNSIPPYAILSHTWGNQEVTFQDWLDQAAATAKEGFAKIDGACSMALRRGLEWAEICFAYLSDVSSARKLSRKSLRRQVRNSRWFTRGWTLQELLAPQHMLFYAADWSRIGRREPVVG
ncbi:hypothetical protein N0V84_011381 [Fusarium piperis]|uniref:Heterokaryon incompatibility domain-containing protein n=1 Tax=Fusarium piperis TaxID=1435070 RepID=A0A9W8TC09_9HYPO|nr:hypothetical protein N0V84_011381 [Fusarium piperis]